MTNIIRITSDAEIGVLTFRGQFNSEYDGDAPINWIRFFLGRDPENPDAYQPDYDRILYLRNINIAPRSGGAIVPGLPIWHAAAITLYQEQPTGILLVEETSVMDYLVQIAQPTHFVQAAFPEAEIGEIRIDLIDAEERPMTGLQPIKQPCQFLNGWPSERSRQSYLRMNNLTQTITQKTGCKASTSFTYELHHEEVNVELSCIYCFIDMADEHLLIVMHDDFDNSEAW